FRWRHRSRQDGPGVALEQEEAPPSDTLQRKVHHPAVNEPILMRSGRFLRMRLGRWFRLGFPLMRDVIIDLPIEGHHPPDGAHGDILSGQETPDAELASVRMGLLEVIDLDHDWEPDLAWGLGAGLAAQQPRKVLDFKAPNPAIDRGTRDLQKAADAALRPS